MNTKTNDYHFRIAVVTHRYNGLGVAIHQRFKACAVNETITLNARGPQLEVKCESVAGSETTTYTEFPSTFKVATPGTYSFSQTTYSGSPVKELVYVHIPSKESNIYEKADTVKAPERTQDDTEYYKDVIFFVAAAMVALLFLEWWLQSRETM